MMAVATMGTPVRAPRVDPAVRWLAWIAMLLGSAIPEILCHKSRQDAPPWIPLTQCLILLAIALFAYRSVRFRGLVRFILAVAALWFGWCVATPWLMAAGFLHEFLIGANWGERLLVNRTLPLCGAALMCLTLIGSGFTRRDLYLCRGNISAPAPSSTLLGLRRPLSWGRFGPLLLVLFGIALPLFLYLKLRPDFAANGRILQFLPWILGVAALNAANEEFQFRNVLLAHLRNVIPPGDAALLTALLFGIGHYYGQPSGPLGVVMAAFAGWIWAKSMLETRGFFWAFTIHMVQDIVIFCFLVMAPGM